MVFVLICCLVAIIGWCCSWSGYKATEGIIVCDKNCEKIHYMAPNIYCCGAGTAADTEAVTDMVSSQLNLHRYATGNQSRVVTALTLSKTHLFSHQGHVSAALVLGGVDVTGPHLHTIYPHGSTDTLPYATMGSGSLAAMAMFESQYREGMTDGTEYLRNHMLIYHDFTAYVKVLSTKIKQLKEKVIEVGFERADAMEE
ncbi:hypothetical protein C5167_026023 [Papaver somniferum]|nr:hypothetical protein C5167_026023 [Papaver somniferum]